MDREQRLCNDNYKCSRRYHMVNSLHYKGCAIDIRSRDMKDPLIVSKGLNNILGPDFDVIFEGDHIHIEYDKK